LIVTTRTSERALALRMQAAESAKAAEGQLQRKKYALRQARIESRELAT
jgi:hypothetical protein